VHLLGKRQRIQFLQEWAWRGLNYLSIPVKPEPGDVRYRPFTLERGGQFGGAFLAFADADKVYVFDTLLGADSGVHTAPKHGYVHRRSQPLRKPGHHGKVWGPKADSNQERVDILDQIYEELFFNLSRWL